MTVQSFSSERTSRDIDSNLLCFRKVVEEVLSRPLDDDHDDSDENISLETAINMALETFFKIDEIIGLKMNQSSLNSPTYIINDSSITKDKEENHPLMECTIRTSQRLQTWMMTDSTNTFASKHTNKKSTRQELVHLVQVTKLNATTDVLALVLLVSHLALDPYSPTSVSRALVSGLLSSTTVRQTQQDKSNKMSNDILLVQPISSCQYTHGQLFALKAIQALLHISLEGHTVDLQIVSRLAKYMELQSYPPYLSHLCSSVIQKHRKHSNSFSNQDFTDTDKQCISDVLGLAAQFAPWSHLSPVPLVETAINHQLWYAAERICDSCISYNSLETNEVIQTLIDGTRDQHLYRMMDTYATTYYNHGGKSRFAEARYMHACDTISKVIPKRQYPIIEKQVERVDEAYNRIKVNDDTAVGNDDTNMIHDSIERNGPQEIREFVLIQLREANQHDVAHRLASLWGFDTFYHQDVDFEQIEKARREKYIQYQNVFPGTNEVPTLISSPQSLIQSIEAFIESIGPGPSVIGFDVEWGEEKGAALLQLSTVHEAILIDIPALIQTEDGCNSLDWIGNIFAGNIEPTIIVAGFSCSEDISRLKASSALGVRMKPWLVSTNAVVDIKPLVTLDKVKLKHLGLSRLCEIYFGKPLDKSEQCSSWLRRPLTKYQCEYACLDSWAVVAIWHQLRYDITAPYLKKKVSL